MKMRSNTVFRNPAIENGREGYVDIGDEFETDDVHARELQVLGHASPIEAEEPKAGKHARRGPKPANED